MLRGYVINLHILMYIHFGACHGAGARQWGGDMLAQGQSPLLGDIEGALPWSEHQAGEGGLQDGRGRGGRAPDVNLSVEIMMVIIPRKALSHTFRRLHVPPSFLVLSSRR
jgi:hypothetical protein